MLGLLGAAAIGVMLITMGILSWRLGRVTHAAPYYRGFYVAAGMVIVGVLIRGANLSGGLVVSTADQEGLLLVYNLLVAAGMTLGLLVAWRYWSWLLAERD